MPFGSPTGATAEELEQMKEEHKESPLFQEHGVPFDVAYCLTKIGKQPEGYDGPVRFCKQYAARKDEYNDHEYNPDVYHRSCRYHGKSGCDDNLEPHPLAPITHGLRAEDENLRMDFTDEEQALYDGIVEHWPQAYDWPEESDDPARYLMLRKVATNVVRSVRAEDYLDDEGEVQMRAVYDEDGVEVGEEPEENTISREYRLLVNEITNQLKELGLTPKERARMDKNEAEAGAADTLGNLAEDAIDKDDAEYDPEQFDQDNADG